MAADKEIIETRLSKFDILSSLTKEDRAPFIDMAIEIFNDLNGDNILSLENTILTNMAAHLFLITTPSQVRVGDRSTTFQLKDIGWLSTQAGWLANKLSKGLLVTTSTKVYVLRDC